MASATAGSGYRPSSYESREEDGIMKIEKLRLRAPWAWDPDL